jgi:hypothetical protein
MLANIALRAAENCQRQIHRIEATRRDRRSDIDSPTGLDYSTLFPADILFARRATNAAPVYRRLTYQL